MRLLKNSFTDLWFVLNFFHTGVEFWEFLIANAEVELRDGSIFSTIAMTCVDFDVRPKLSAIIYVEKHNQKCYHKAGEYETCLIYFFQLCLS